MESIRKSHEIKMQDTWGGVTDPIYHNPDKFRYLIHLDSGWSNTIDPEDQVSDDVWEYLLDQPEKIKTLPSISASLVDQDHPIIYQGTASNHGFIFEVPKSSVIAADSRDMFSRIKTLDQFGEFYISNPDQLLEDTKRNEWNEVVVSPNGLVIRAIFWVDTSNNEKPNVERKQVMKTAQLHNLPFIDLQLEKY